MMSFYFITILWILNSIQFFFPPVSLQPLCAARACFLVNLFFSSSVFFAHISRTKDKSWCHREEEKNQRKDGEREKTQKKAPHKNMLAVTLKWWHWVPKANAPNEYKLYYSDMGIYVCILYYMSPYMTIYVSTSFLISLCRVAIWASASSSSHSDSLFCVCVRSFTLVYLFCSASMITYGPMQSPKLPHHRAELNIE